MFSNLQSIIYDLDVSYNKDGLKEYIRDVLTKLSNSDIPISEYDNKIVKLRFSRCDFDIFKESFTNALSGGEFDKYLYSYKFDMYGSGYLLRNIFGNINLCDIINIVELILSIDDSCFDSISESSSDNIYCYIDCLLHNLKVLSVFTGISSDSVDIDVEDILSKVEFAEDYDLDAALLEIEENISYDEKDEESLEEEEKTLNKDEKELKDAANHRDNIKNIGSKIVKISSMINKGSMNVKSFLDKLNIIRTNFYKKYIGKIDHLYKNYGSDATILENKLNGDPVKILFEKSGKYLSDLIDGIILVYKNYNKHIEKLFNCSNMSEMILEINSYLTYDEVKLKEDATAKDINRSLKLDLRYKFAKLLLKDNDIYGHTVESIVLKKYPNINHVMVSLFIPLPHEKPVEQSVNEVFESADSFKILSGKMKDIVLQSSKLINTKVSSVNIGSDFKRITTKIKDFKSIDKVNKVESDKIKTETDKSPSRDLNQRINVLRNHEHIIESFVPIFIYIANAGNVMYDLCIRIDKTAQDAIKSLANVERSRSDGGRYKTGTSAAQKDEFRTSTNRNPEKVQTKKSAKKEFKKKLSEASTTDSGSSVTKLAI